MVVARLGQYRLSPDGTAPAPSTFGRASYIFNPTIAGIEQADALLIVGANPRVEAAVLNARIRKRWRMGGFPIGVIGEQAELRYGYEYLGAGPETLSELVDGTNKFAETLKNAKHPMIIVGQGALCAPMASPCSAMWSNWPHLSARFPPNGTGWRFSTRQRRASVVSTSVWCRARGARPLPRC